MTKIDILSLSFFLLLVNPVLAQAKLEKMITERETLTKEWNESESQKSGVFGNRTKKDMIETNVWLEQIIAKDNQIIEELKMLSSIESAQLSQAKDDYKSIAFRCEAQVQTLKRVVSEKEKEIAVKQNEKRPYEWASLILFLASFSLGYWVYKLKK